MKTPSWPKRPLALLTAVSLLPMALLASHAQADCERGALDALYCDENGDMVADRPADESNWANPSTLIFAYTPVEDPAITPTSGSRSSTTFPRSRAATCASLQCSPTLPRWKPCAAADCTLPGSRPARRPLP